MKRKFSLLGLPVMLAGVLCFAASSASASFVIGSVTQNISATIPEAPFSINNSVINGGGTTFSTWTDTDRDAYLESTINNTVIGGSNLTGTINTKVIPELDEPGEAPIGPVTSFFDVFFAITPATSTAVGYSYTYTPMIDVGGTALPDFLNLVDLSTSTTTDLLLSPSAGVLSLAAGNYEITGRLTYSQPSPVNNNLDSGTLNYALHERGEDLPVPEPATMTMLGLGLLGFAARRRLVRG